MPPDIAASRPGDLVGQLTRCPLFASVRPDHMRDMAGLGHLVRFGQGEVILRQGDSADAMYVLLNGLVRVTREDAQGADVCLAYLLEGQTFGEVGLLDSAPRAASVTAMVESTAWRLYRGEFEAVCHCEPQVAIEMIRSLGRRLAQASERLGRKGVQSRLILVDSADEDLHAYAAPLALSVASRLGQMSGERTAIAGFPVGSARTWMEDLRAVAAAEAGVEVPAEAIAPNIPAELSCPCQSSLVLESLQGRYPDIVAVTTGGLCELDPLLASAACIVEVCSSHRANVVRAQGRLAELTSRLAGSDAQRLLVVLADARGLGPTMTSEYLTAGEAIDAILPISDEPWSFATADLFSSFAFMLAERLDRSHSVSVYVPSTIDVSRSADPLPTIERTMGFLGERFGGATSKRADGVWKSSHAGLVGETIHVVQSYARPADLRAHLPAVVDFVRGLKQELKQEAMAMEIDRRMVLL